MSLLFQYCSDNTVFDHLCSTHRAKKYVPGVRFAKSDIWFCLVIGHFDGFPITCASVYPPLFETDAGNVLR